MSKRKAKPSQAQRDKYNIAVAKKLKQDGIISKQADLHSGRYISKSVLRKVKAYTASAELNYKAYKIPKELARRAQERGFQVVAGNKVIGPKTPSFRNRLTKGELTGVRPVKGGMMEEVILPYSVFDMRSLINQLEQGIDTLKDDDEQFAFKFFGNESYRAFLDSKQLLKYLRHYKAFDTRASMKPEDQQDAFDAFTIFRLNKNSVNENIRGPQKRARDKKQARLDAIARGEYVPRKRKSKSREEKMARMGDAEAKRFIAKMAKKDADKRARIIADPERYNKTKERARQRAAKSYQRRKGK